MNTRNRPNVIMYESLMNTSNRPNVIMYESLMNTNNIQLLISISKLIKIIYTFVKDNAVET